MIIELIEKTRDGKLKPLDSYRGDVIPGRGHIIRLHSGENSYHVDKVIHDITRSPRAVILHVVQEVG